MRLLCWAACELLGTPIVVCGWALGRLSDLCFSDWQLLYGTEGQLTLVGAGQGHVGQLPVGPEKQMWGGLMWGVPEGQPLTLQAQPCLPPGACSTQHPSQHTVNIIGEELSAARPSSRYISDAAMMFNCMQTPVLPTAGLYGSE